MFETMSVNTIRFWFFLGGLLLFIVMGLVYPFRIQRWKSNWHRRRNNILLSSIGAGALFFLSPISLFAVAAKPMWSGLLSFFSDHSGIKILLGVVAMDFIVYLQHRAFHAIPWLWRMHRVHHTDTEFDATTAVRFHPLELGISYLIKMASVVILGIPLLGVVLSEILLNFSAMFNHANFDFSPRIDRFIRAFIVTPGMHRIHHSALTSETNSNFGFCISLWDQLLNTRVQASIRDPKTMRLGLEEFRTFEDQGVVPLLKQPFRRLQG